MRHVTHKHGPFSNTPNPHPRSVDQMVVAREPSRFRYTNPDWTTIQIDTDLFDRVPVNYPSLNSVSLWSLSSCLVVLTLVIVLVKHIHTIPPPHTS